MNINRHNYEEFFLLYVDNELPAADRKAVDQFVEENPDLQGELLMLLQTVLKADAIILEKKDWLFMEEGISALQENLLLYADNELPAHDKKAIETLLATDKTTQAEWNILRQTKLQPDPSVVFGDKPSLYRAEGSRVVVYKWWRAAAAAVLLGLVLWTGVSVYKNNIRNSGTNGIANGQEIKTEKQKNEAPVNSGIAVTKPAIEIASPQRINTSIVKNEATAPATGKNKQANQKTGKQNRVDQKDNIAVVSTIPKPSNHLPRPYFENINNTESNGVTRNNVITENNNNTINSGNNTVIVKTNPNEKITSPVVAGTDNNNTDPATLAAIPVVNKTTDENNNRYLDIDESKGKRTLLGGILRKAKRMLERNTNIKTGDGLKVAGFEIALK